MAPPDEDVSAGSILRELILNQYQAIVAGGAAIASVLTLNPLPFLFWLGSEMVLLPILDSGPLRRLVAKRRRELARAQQAERRAAAIASFEPAYAKRYAAMEQRCEMIENNYQGLSGISQAYLFEQRGKLDSILDGCLNRMLALQRYDKVPMMRNPGEIKREIADLQKELSGEGLNDRARAALQKNLELKQRLLTSYAEAGGNMKALSTELDSMASLLEVLYQNSLSLRDPQAISDELDTIVKQSDVSDRIVRETEALLRSGGGEWGPDIAGDSIVPLSTRAPQSATTRQKAGGR
jgi:hypothetical protein